MKHVSCRQYGHAFTPYLDSGVRNGVMDTRFFHRPFITFGYRSDSYEQPAKSSSLAVVVVPAITLRGMPFVSVLVVNEDGVQIAVPPDIGLAASALTVKSTSPAAGGVKEIVPAENVPTSGLLAGTTNVYCAQNAPTGAPVAGQAVADSTATFDTEPDNSGIVTGRVAPPESEIVCSALVVTSMFAPAVPFSAETTP